MNQIDRFLNQTTAKDQPRATIWTTMAWLVSVVLHPLLMPTYLHGFVFKFCGDLVPLTRTAKVQTLLFIFVSTYFIPVMVTGFLWVTGIISNLTLERRSERIIPLLVTGMVYCGVSYVFLNYLDMVQILGFFMGVVALTVILTAGITQFWKISSHMVGIGGVCGFLGSVILQTNNQSLLWPLVGTVFGAGAVASSRLFLQVHTQLQIVIGFFLGLTISWLSVIYLV